MRKVLLISVPALIVTALAVLLLVEVSIRLTWDPRRGRPGLFVSDPVRLEKLAANYDGWFAGVPVRINALGFRDVREYPLKKASSTFRILVLGDSVTFGHGSVYEHTYPFLLEEQLKRWNPQIDWQVWNLGVPGYNTSQELAYLLDSGPSFQPDLVIVGFFANDLVENRPVQPAGRKAVAASAVKTWMRRHAYSFDWYRKVYLSLRYRLAAAPEERQLLDSLDANDKLLAKPSQLADARAQELTSPQPMSNDQVATTRCVSRPRTVFSKDQLLKTPGLEAWKATVREFQALAQSGRYRIVFFVNAAPDICRTDVADEDLFDARASKPLDEFYLDVLSNGTPAVSSHDAFLRYRPSQVPNAASHSIGNANAVKAGVLFEFMRDRVFPTILHSSASGTP